MRSRSVGDMFRHHEKYLGRRTSNGAESGTDADSMLWGGILSDAPIPLVVFLHLFRHPIENVVVHCESGLLGTLKYRHLVRLHAPHS